MKFYVGKNAEAIADVVWAAAGNTSGNTNKSAGNSEAQKPLELKWG
jgi:hypothetical protein